MIARRCLWMPPTLLGLVLLVFAISHVIPSDPARVMAGENAPPEQIEALRHKYWLDRPLPVQFAHYVADVARGNMGISLFTQRPVSEDLFARLPATLELALYAIVIAVMAGVPLGVVAALRRNSWLDHVVRVVTVAGLAMAAFWLAILLQLLFSMWLGWTLCFRRSPRQAEVIAVWSALFPQLLQGFQIDTNHWRHMFLMVSCIYGLAAAERIADLVGARPVGSRLANV